jgi:hypothetical protein
VDVHALALYFGISEQEVRDYLEILAEKEKRS